MTAKILLSEIERAKGTAEEYAQHVERHVENLNSWHEHHKDHKDDPDKHFEEGRKGAYPYPNPHSVVHSGVRQKDDGTFVADYEIVDDVSQTKFEQKKQVLIHIISKSEEDELRKIHPPLKVRSWGIRESDIREAESKIFKGLMMTDAGHTGLSVEEANARVAAQRSKEDTDFLADQEARRVARDKVVRHVAQMFSEIEDLTPETIDDWKPSPLNPEN